MNEKRRNIQYEKQKGQETVGKKGGSTKAPPSLWIMIRGLLSFCFILFRRSRGIFHFKCQGIRYIISLSLCHASWFAFISKCGINEFLFSYCFLNLIFLLLFDDDFGVFLNKKDI